MNPHRLVGTASDQHWLKAGAEHAGGALTVGPKSSYRLDWGSLPSKYAEEGPSLRGLAKISASE